METVGKGEMSNLLVCNDKGGVGKSVVSHLLALVLLDCEKSFRILECEKTPRLARIFGDFVYHRPVETQSVSEIYEDPDVLFSYWDRIATELADQTTSIVDMGAGVTFSFARWAQANGHEVLSGGAGQTIIMVTTAEQESWRSARGSLDSLSRLLPAARFVVVYNERDGAFHGHSLGDYEAIVLKAMRAPIWPHLQNDGRFDLLAQQSSAEAARKYGVPVGTAARSLYAFTDWILESTDALAGAVNRLESASMKKVAHT